MQRHIRSMTGMTVRELRLNCSLEAALQNFRREPAEPFVTAFRSLRPLRWPYVRHTHEADGVPGHANTA